MRGDTAALLLIAVTTGGLSACKAQDSTSRGAKSVWWEPRTRNSGSTLVPTTESSAPPLAEPPNRGPGAPQPDGPAAWLMEGRRICPAPPAPTPALHQPFTDPVFGTRIVRITDPSQRPGVSRIRHYYSKANPFNADNTRAILIGGDGSTLLYDTSSWTPIRDLSIRSSDAEIHWHPSDPNVLYHLDMVGDSGNVRGFFRQDIGTGKKTLMHDFAEYDTARGKLEGNLDRNGRYYAMIGMRGARDLEAFVYDLQEDRVSTRVKVTAEMAGDWISVSPSGRYVVLMGDDRSRIYDIQMKHLRDLPKGSYGHGDLCLTADGREVMVYDAADHPLDRNRNINIADLELGTVQIGLRIGWKSTPHVSCRNLDAPGWALISTQGPDRDYPNYDFEVFWLDLRGTGSVRRLAHHHSSRAVGGYFAEQHAVTNRSGTLLLFASNWGGRVVNDYLIDLRQAGTANPGACR